MTQVLAIDPGQTTGVVVAELQNYEIASIVQQYEMGWARRFELIPLVAGLCASDGGTPPQCSVIVLEAFRLYPHEHRRQVGSDFPSVRVIGIVEAAAFICGFDLNNLFLLPAGVKNKVAILPQHAPLIMRSEHVRDAYKLARYHAVMLRRTTT